MGVNKRGFYTPWGYQEENDYTSSKTQFELELEKLFASADFNKDDKKIHFYNLDGEEFTDSAIDTKQFASDIIESAVYDKETKILTITFSNGDTVEINLADLIDENEFADGLVVDAGVVKVLIDPSSDSYLTVSEDGVKLSGIESGFTEINNKITNIEGDITEINSAITNIQGDITEINSSITEINSAITNVEGDIYNINSSITEINSAITNIQGDITEIDNSIVDIYSAITNVEGDIYNINSSITEINSAITNFEGDIYNIYSSITEINSALTEGVTDVILNEEGNLELMNKDELLGIVELRDQYYNKQEISDKELTISAALNDLNDRKFDYVEYIPGTRLRSCGSLKFYSTNEDIKTELFSINLDELFDNASFTNKYINKAIYEDTTSGDTETGEVVTYKAINFYNVTESGETLVSSIDARPFLEAVPGPHTHPLSDITDIEEDASGLIVSDDADDTIILSAGSYDD